ncbi:hypothetical protein AB431_10695 [Mycobacterium sp. EPa45]|nr:hypothetical protein AB431_10695 [Mycobacterium sp. EPa45]
MLSDIARQIDYTFFNKAPTANPSQGQQTGPDKTIAGALNGASNNGFGLSYSIAEMPKYGNAFVDPNTGAYSYTARKELITPGITDSFTVQIDNGASARLPGLLGQLQLALHSMAVALGVAKPDTIYSTISVTITGTSDYGDPTTNAAWWQKQTIDNDCVLIAVASALGQLSGTMPSEAAIVDVAKNTPSVVNPASPMYVGSKAETGFGGVKLEDAVALLQKYGLAAQLVTYVDPALPGEAPNKATLTDGARALLDVEAALAGGEAVIAIVNAQIIYTAAGNAYPTPFFEANHAIQVTGVDISTGKVYVNDGNLMTGSTPISIGAFMWGWMGSDFNTIYAEKPAQSAAAAVDTGIAA